MSNELSLPVGIRVKVGAGRPDGPARIFVLDGTGNVTHALEPLEARQLAGVLLAHADALAGESA